jgi:hypothetical protein
MSLALYYLMLCDAVIPLDTPERRRRYRLNQFPRFFDLDNVDKRYRWELLMEADPNLVGFLMARGVSKRSIDRMLKQIVFKY